MITPCAQTLQSLGTFTGASHQEIRCRLHNSNIESRVIYLYDEIMGNEIVMRCDGNRISRKILREVFSVCKHLRTQIWLAS